jgi:hypothetical protein
MRREESKLLRLALALLVCATFLGCGGPLRFTPQGTEKAPGADALITAAVNAEMVITRLNITVKNLPPPGRLEPSASDFVVWARKDGDTPWQRIGALKYDGDARKGELVEASVPQTQFELIISIEKQSDPASPSPSVVISQKIEN